MTHTGESRDNKLFLTCAIERRKQTSGKDELYLWKIKEIVVVSGKDATPLEGVRRTNSQTESFFEAELISEIDPLLDGSIVHLLEANIHGSLSMMNTLMSAGVQPKEGSNAGEMLKEIFGQNLKISQDRTG